MEEFGTCDSNLDCCGGYGEMNCDAGYCRFSGCEDDLDCESGNCIDGACQGNDTGDLCDSDFYCAGGDSECVDGVCQPRE